MPFAYSVDFRKKALEAFGRGEGKTDVCRMLGIARSTFDNWLALREETGGLEPRPLPGAARRFCREALREDVSARPDDTLAERAGRFGVKAEAVRRALRAEGITYKKRASSSRSATRP